MVRIIASARGRRKPDSPPSFGGMLAKVVIAAGAAAK
jgi:hypothetical protein